MLKMSSHVCVKLDSADTRAMVVGFLLALFDPRYGKQDPLFLHSGQENSLSAAPGTYEDRTSK